LERLRSDLPLKFGKRGEKENTSPYIIRVKDAAWIPSTQNLPPQLKIIINDKVENHIAVQPYHSERLDYELSGLWSYNKIQSDSRIIYAICEDCRKRKLTAMNNCGECKELPDNTIMLWIFGGHDMYEDLKREREKAWKKTVKQRRRERGH
jgi:Txe/YoeB family toxin of Txe-Axe toxin-antitoxin module